MKFEPWRLDPRIIDVSDDEDNRLGLIHNPHSELASFFTLGKGSEIELDDMREILKHMEPTSAVQSAVSESKLSEAVKKSRELRKSTDYPDDEDDYSDMIEGQRTVED